MAYDAHSNGGYSTVAAAPSPATSGTVLTLHPGDGIRFPTPPFNTTVKPFGTLPMLAGFNVNAEIVRVTALSATTVASGSNGVNLPQATINGVSTAGYPSSGTFSVMSSNGWQLITYTSISGNAFTGCTGGSGTLATGNALIGDQITIARAQESTSAQSIGVGWEIASTVTAKTLTDIESATVQKANNLSDISNATAAFNNIKQSATTAATGVIQLAGDLSGTATSPYVLGLQRVFNVKDNGATGNGTTDDLAACQAAIDACNTAGGGVVYFPWGVYLLGGELFYRGYAGVATFNIVFRGAGRELSILRLKSGVATATGSNKIRGVIAGYYNGAESPLTPFTSSTTNTFDMFDLTIDYNGANQTINSVVWGLLLDNRGQRSLIQNCRFTNVFVPSFNKGTPAYGIPIDTYDSQYPKIINCVFDNCDEGPWLTTYAQGNPLHAAVTDNQIHNITDAGIYYESGQYATIKGNFIKTVGGSGIYGQIITSTLDTNAVVEGNTIEGATSYGILMQGNYNSISANKVNGSGYHGISSKGYGCTVEVNNLENVGNSTDGSVYRCGIHIEGNYNSICGNTGITINDHGIELSGASYCTVRGNTILDAGQWADNTYMGIILSNISTHNTVDGNTITALATNKIKYGIAEASSADDYNMFGMTNQITGADVAPIQQLGSHTAASIANNEVIMISTVNDRGYTLQGATTSISPTFKIADVTGSVKARIGIAGSTNGLVTGSAAGDLVIRAETGGTIRFTANSGSSSSLALTGSAAIWADGLNFVFGTSTGTKIGTSTSQLLAFYNATPIVQPTGDLVAAMSNLGLIASSPAISGGFGAEVTVTTSNDAVGFTLKGATTNVSPQFKIADSGGTVQARIGIAGAAGNLVTGSSTDDLVFRTHNHNIHLTTNDGTSATLSVVGQKIGIDNVSPTAYMHLPAGTASANTSPLKFTVGVNLTTPEAGAVEFDGSHFYGTIGSTRYQLDQQTDVTSFATLTKFS